MFGQINPAHGARADQLLEPVTADYQTCFGVAYLFRNGQRKYLFTGECIRKPR
jgi:hypothetical protein